MYQCKYSPLSSVPHIVLKRQQQELFPTDNIIFASNYSLQVKKKANIELKCKSTFTVEETDKTFCLGCFCLAYSCNSQAHLLDLYYLVIPYIQVQEASLMLPIELKNLDFIICNLSQGKDLQ